METVTEVKRGRGRPKGSKNKAKTNVEKPVEKVECCCGGKDCCTEKRDEAKQE